MTADSARRARGVLVAAAAVFACLCALPATASEQGRAERLYTKGLAELHAGNDAAAVALFQQAVEADPKDVHALYYRALGYGHVGRYEESAADLKIVVAAGDPAIDRDRLELGYALYRLDRYDEAIAELQIASQEGRSAGEATMLIGIIESRRGNQDAARAAFGRVEALDPSKAVAAHYYMGLAAYRAGDSATATEQFTWVRKNGGDSPFVKEASDFLARLDEGGSARPYELHALFALEYDSNVALAPDDDNLTENVLGISNEGDGRAVMGAGGRYAVISKPNFHLSLGYDFLQTLHFDLERFDIQVHRVGGQSEYVHGALSLGVAGFYEHSLLDEESLLNGGNLLPYVRYDEGEFGHTEAYYRMRARDFTLSPYSPRRDSINHAIGARQFFALGSLDRYFILGYRYDNDVADWSVGNEFDYNGHQVEAGFDWQLMEGLNAGLLYAYRHEDYCPASDNRDDDEHTLVTRVEKRLHDYVWLVGSYIFRSNDSDQEFFEYTRHITSLGVEVRY